MSKSKSQYQCHAVGCLQRWTIEKQVQGEPVMLRKIFPNKDLIPKDILQRGNYAFETRAQ